MVVLLELLARGVLCEELGEALGVIDQARWKGVEPVGGCSLQAGGEDPTRVISSMDHYIVLILAEMGRSGRSSTQSVEL